MMRHQFFRGIAATMAALVGAGSGCGFGLPPVNLEDLPGEINFVVANRSTLDQSSSDPLSGVEAGTAMDALTADALDGCWGAFGVVTLEDTDSSGNPLPSLSADDYEMYRFDATAGTLEWQVYRVTNAPLVGALIAYDSSAGDFELADGNGANWTITMVMYTNPLTAEVESSNRNELNELQITLSGTSMKVLNVTEAEYEPSNRADLVFKQFACP